MFLLRSGSLIETHAPAKLNLFLEVLSRREDGFHEIETIMTAISIFDTLYFSTNSERQIRLTCQWACGLQARQFSQRSIHGQSALGELPSETDNIVFRAIERLRQRAGEPLGASVHLVKRIPAAAGLGGASSDAAAALIAANAAWKLGYSIEQLAEVAAELGSDVPFFLGAFFRKGGAAVCRGRGERIEPMAQMPKLHFVVARPPAGLSTFEVYRQCRVADRPQPIDPMLAALHVGRPAPIAQRLHNRLQQPAAALSPWIENLQREFNRFDLLGHQMSGSGSSYFGICRHARHARRVAARLRSRKLGAVFSASTVF